MRCTIVLGLLVALFFAAPAQATDQPQIIRNSAAPKAPAKKHSAKPKARASAYTYQAECMASLSGSPPGTDNEVWETIGIANAHAGGVGNVQDWYWGYFHRYSANYMRQDYYLIKWYGYRIQVIAYCYDGNLSGEVSSSEDWWTSMFSGV